MIVSSIVLGYHGCDHDVAESVFSGKKELAASRNEYDWLGEGVYFWENSPLRASRWAEEQCKRGKVKKSAVVGAIIDLGNCLDLTDQVSLDLLKGVHESMVLFHKYVKLPMPENKRTNPADQDLLMRNLDCAVINFCHEIRMKDKSLLPFNTVRGVFQEGGSLFAGSEMREKTHIQIAVRSTTNIIGYFRPRDLSK